MTEFHLAIEADDLEILGASGPLAVRIELVLEYVENVILRPTEPCQC